MSKFERKEETREVKRFLIQKGYKNVRVGHGCGTAWGWLEVSVDIPKPKDCYCTLNQYGQTERCHLCKNAWSEAYSRVCKEVMDFTGRSGDYDGRTGVEIGWIKEEAKTSMPERRVDSVLNQILT